MNTAQPQNTSAIAANTLAKDLLSALVTEIKLLPDVWPKLVQDKQNEIIDRLRARVISGIAQAVNIISSQGKIAIAGELEQILVKDGAKATIKIESKTQSLHDLCEMQAQRIFIVSADHLQYLGGVGDIQGEPDQRSFNMGHEYTDTDGAGMDTKTIEVQTKPLQQLPHTDSD